tara:strand:- start:226 stop:462 length:237 start_codon:yes stop_codon:yes gene_type:complete
MFMSNDLMSNGIDLNETEAVVCEECGGYTFTEVVALRRVSAVYSPNGQAGLVPISLFECSSCGHVNEEFKPKGMKDEQ